ncbi:MAG: YqhA family protein [Acidimicrobiia bacterium]
METIFRTRYLSVVAVVFAAIGSILMFVIGAVTTIDGIVTYFGGHDDKAFSSDAALAATVDIVTSLDQFLLGLVLLVFAYGVYSLWIVGDADEWEKGRSKVHAPDWIKITSVTDLKVTLIEVVAVLLAVLFLKGVLLNPQTTWPDLVVPIAVALLAVTVWLIRKAGH